MANIKSQKKRNITNAKAHERNKAVKAEVKTRTKVATETIGTDANDEAVRLAVYRGYVNDGRPPSIEEMAVELAISQFAKIMSSETSILPGLSRLILLMDTSRLSLSQTLISGSVI